MLEMNTKVDIFYTVNNDVYKLHACHLQAHEHTIFTCHKSYCMMQTAKTMTTYFKAIKYHSAINYNLNNAPAQKCRVKVNFTNYVKVNIFLLQFLQQHCQITDLLALLEEKKRPEKVRFKMISYHKINMKFLSISKIVHHCLKSMSFRTNLQLKQLHHYGM